MRHDETWARARFAAARVARLSTVSVPPSGGPAPRLVPVVFAVVGDLLVTAVDHKPKGTTRLARLADIEASPRVSVLVDEYAEDWGQLWWARADGRAQVVAAYDVPDLLRELVNRYPQYADTPPTGPVIVVDVERWTGWSATGSAGSSGAG